MRNSCRVPLLLLLALSLPLKQSICQEKERKEANLYFTAESTGQLLQNTGFILTQEK